MKITKKLDIKKINKKIKPWKDLSLMHKNKNKDKEIKIIGPLKE